MEILADLYTIADKHLSGEVPDWDRFVYDFRDMFRAHAIVYYISFEDDQQTLKAFSVIASTDPETTERYVAKKLYLQHTIRETEMAPLQPVRRTDTYNDDQFRALGEIADFLIANGLFYQMVVPAILADGTFAGLSVWRDEAAGDFSDIEMQRLSLFMRHLMALVHEDQLQLEKPPADVAGFGRKWSLTEAEIEVLAAMLQGLSLKDIAAQSGRSYGTVRWHVQNILEKCQVSSQKDLLREFYRLIRR